MYDFIGRRAALMRIFAGATATRAAGTLSAAAAGSPETARRKPRVRQIWKGKLDNPVITPHPGNDPDRYMIHCGDGPTGGVIHDKLSGKKKRMSTYRLIRYIDHRSGGELKGNQTLRLDGINWRVLRLHHDDQARTWAIDVKLCESNPNAKPRLGAVDTAGLYGYSSAEACSCDICDKCYRCGEGSGTKNGDYYCGLNYDNAC